jgi:iron complex outermembrane recepter protein
MVRYTNRIVAASVALAIAGSALAQEAPAPAEDEVLAEVTVTGSRIQRAVGMTTPTPVAALSADELRSMSPTSVTEALVRMPQFYNSQTAENFGSPSNGFFLSPGGGSLNLRGIGSKRTLTLLDGHRQVPSTAFGGPDINLFPDEVLKRVEVVTGGASAAYGTDAVSGVVNYILDKSFEGFRASAQGGVTERGDGENQKYSLSFGRALGEKSHLIFSAGHSKQNEIVGYEGREWYKGCGYMQNPNVPSNVDAISTVIPPVIPAAWNNAQYTAANGGHSAANPRLVPACNLHNTQLTYDGLVTVGTSLYELQPDGSAIPFLSTRPTNPSIIGAARNSGVQIGGGGQNLSYTDAQILPSSARKNVFAYLDHDFTENFTVYGQGMFGWQTLTQYGRVGDIGSAPPQVFTIQRNNAYLPSSLASIMDAAGATTATMTRAGTREDWGAGSFSNKNDTSTLTLGFNGTIETDGFFNGWSVDGHVQYGKNKLDAAQVGGIRLDRIYLAADAVRTTNGSIVCNVNNPTTTSNNNIADVPDCVPLNIFGRGNASQGAIDWIKGFDPGVAVTTRPFLGYDSNLAPIYADDLYSYVGDEDKHRLVTITQKVFEFNANGKVADGWAGPISAAVGAHWRKESIDQKVRASQGNTAADGTYFPVWCPDNVVTTNARCIAQVNRGIRPAGTIGVRGVPGNPFQNTVEIQFSNVGFLGDSFDVKELYAETIVPLVTEKPYLNSLNFQGAVRWADYAGSGSIWSYKAGLDADVTAGLRLRGTYSHDTRAANIAERFDRTGGFTFGLTDRITPLPAGWTQGVTQATTINGGNPDLVPEEADTLTAGFVYRPTWAPGFDMSVDWLRVSLKNAIEQLLAQRVIDSCYFESDAAQCARIVRDPSTNTILFIPQTQYNLSKSRHESVDVEFGYQRRVHLLGGEGERLSARLFTTYLIENSTTNSQGVKNDFTGNVPLQNFKKKATLNLSYGNGAFNWNLTGRLIAGGILGTASGNYNQIRDLATIVPPTPPATVPSAVTPNGQAVIYDVADNTLGTMVYWDTRVGYNIPMGGGQMELFANITNLLDRDPPLVLGEAIIAQTGGGFDELGRRFVLGFNLKF